MTDQSKNQKFCPFWDKYGKRECRLVESGLFIPTREHILRFCENELYVKCYHYVGRPDYRKKTVQNLGKEYLRNRRQFIRIPIQQKLSVSRYSLANEANEDMLDDGAMVLDLSLGGMQIETAAPIHLNQIISFAFDENFSPPGFKGKGEIRWINQDELRTSTPSNAGLAFIDDDTKNTVRNHLLSMGDKLLFLPGF
jgi:hypothetical protein